MLDFLIFQYFFQMISNFLQLLKHIIFLKKYNIFFKINHKKYIQLNITKNLNKDY
jgi:hypothetical protein